MSRKRTGTIRKQSVERHTSSRECLLDRICRATSEGLTLHAAATREQVTVETLKGWLAEDEAFRARYEKARAIGRSFVLDDVLALADSLPGTGRADIRLKLAARKWWAAEVWKTSKPETPAQAEARMKLEQKKKREEEIAQLEAHWEGVRARQAEEEQRRREAEAAVQPQTSEPVAVAPKPEPARIPEPAAKSPAPPTPPKPKPQPGFTVRFDTGPTVEAIGHIGPEPQREIYPPLRW